MGKWFAEFLLKDDKEVIIHGRNEKKLLEVGKQLNVESTTSISTAVKDADIVLISVPIDAFEAVAKELQHCLNKDQIVIDITSVKVLPVEVMHCYLHNVTVLGTHPVFGPGAKSVRNQNFVLTPTDDGEIALAEKLRCYLEGKGARVTIMTPQKHDEMMAVVLGLAHFIAITSADVLLIFSGLETMKAIGGPTYKVLLTLAESVITEDPELYASIQRNLPGMGEMEELFQRSAVIWTDIVKNKDRNEFIERMNALKTRLGNTVPDFGRSYEDMYRLLDEE